MSDSFVFFLIRIVLLYLLIINTAAAIAAIIDKRRAVRCQWRVPERTLLLLGLFGGALGEFITMRLIRHKTKHMKFMILLPLFIVLHIAVIVFLIVFI